MKIFSDEYKETKGLDGLIGDRVTCKNQAVWLKSHVKQLSNINVYITHVHGFPQQVVEILLDFFWHNKLETY